MVWLQTSVSITVVVTVMWETRCGPKHRHTREAGGHNSKFYFNKMKSTKNRRGRKKNKISHEDKNKVETKSSNKVQIKMRRKNPKQTKWEIRGSTDQEEETRRKTD